MSDKFSKFAESIFLQKYAHTKADGTQESWEETAERVACYVMGATPVSTTETAEQTLDLIGLIRDRKFLPGGRYLYASGRPLHQTQNCLLLRAEDSREGWADLMQKATLALMTGAGIGVDYSGIRAEGSPISRTGGTCTGPLALMQMVNEAGRHIMQGGARRSAIWAGLRWDHPDTQKFLEIKKWSPEVRALKERDFMAPAPMDGTNVSVLLDRKFFEAYNDTFHPDFDTAQEVYWKAVRSMLQYGEPGFSVDYENSRESLRNACTEVVSEDDSDICNLGSINLARIRDIAEFSKVVELSTIFLLAGTLYSDVPYPQVAEIRTKNRRLGLGLMGIHEWLLKRNYAYAPNAELAQWLEVYRDVSERTAQVYSKAWGISTPIATRAIAPTGTIGIIAETTTGIEPIFCAAYKRRYKGPDGQSTQYQYVVDPTALRLLEAGIPEEKIQDAYSLAENVEHRLAFQHWVQQYVDQGISSTVNLPAWGTPLNDENRVQEFGEMLLTYLPGLRGMTVYPDGAIGGQPLTPCSLSEALGREGEVFLEQADMCDITKGGSCGS